MRNDKFWEMITYIALTLCMIGNITVGSVYLFAQFIYLIANGLNLIRTFVLKRTVADKVRDIAFFAVTIGLIILRIWG